jgi:copper chaperone
MTEKTVTIPKISCGHCVATIKRELGELPGVTVVDADPETKQVTINWQDPATWETIRATLEEIGYPPQA